MNDILVINTKRHGDIIQSAPVIASLKEMYPYSKISLLVFDEFKSSAGIIANIDNIYTIGRKKILTVYKNKLFNNAMALNFFMSSLAPVINQKWDLIINYSHDLFSAHLSGSLNATKVIGISRDEFENISYDSNWDKLLNNVISRLDISPIHFTEFQYKRLSLSPSKKEKFKVLDSNNQKAKSNIQAIKESKSRDTKIVAIQKFASNDDKSLSDKQIYPLIQYIKNSSEFIPIVLCSPFDKDFVNQVKSDFQNTVTCVESDFLGLVSLFNYIDYLITPDTSVKHIADIKKVKILEVSQNSPSHTKQGQTTNGGLILTLNKLSKDYELKQENSAKKNSINPKDIIQSFEVLANIKGPLDIKLDHYSTLYKVKNTAGKIWYIPYSGNLSIENELLYLTMKLYLEKKFNVENDQNILGFINDFFDPNEILDWSTHELKTLEKITKSTLNALRFIGQIKNSTSRPGQLINEIDKLLSDVNLDSCTRIPLALFEGEFNQLSKDNGLMELEDHLFQLKNDLIIYSNILSKILERCSQRIRVTRGLEKELF